LITHRGVFDFHGTLHRINMIATSYGLAFAQQNMLGGWVIPWADLGSWQKAHPLAPNTTSSKPAPEPVKASP